MTMLYKETSKILDTELIYGPTNGFPRGANSAHLFLTVEVQI